MQTRAGMRDWRPKVATIAGGGLTIAVAMVMVLAPATSAAGTNVVLTKPYKTLTAAVYTSIASSGCGVAKLTKVSTWNAKKGTLTASGSASAPACKNTNENYAEYDSEIDLSATNGLTFSKTGNYTITLDWVAAYSAAWNLTPYKSCKLQYAASYSECYAEASADLGVETELYDSNFSVFQYVYNDTDNYTFLENYSSNGCYPTSVCASGGNATYGANGAFSGRTTFTQVINLSGAYAVTNTSTVYYFVAFGFADVFTETYLENAKVVGTSTATASLDLNGGGRGLTLKGISIV